MLILAARYSIVFFWLLISGNNGNILLMRNMETEDQNIYSVSACTAKCMLLYQRQQTEEHHNNQQIKQQDQQQQHLLSTDNQPTSLEFCYDICHNQSSETLELKNVRKIHENLYLQLVCRDENSLTFRIDTERTASSKSSTLPSPSTVTPATTATDSVDGIELPKNTPIMHKAITASPNVYVIKLQEAEEYHAYSVYLSDENFFTVENLKSNTTHNITAVAAYANNEYSVIAKGEQYTTLSRGFTPGKVHDIQIRKFFVDDANEALLLTAKIAWKPAADMTCHYNIICFSPESEEYDMTPLEIRNPRQLYTYNLENWTFSSNYKIGIRAKNPNNFLKESELFWKTFKAPSCLEWYNYNFNVCAPLKPEELNVEQYFIGENDFSLNISWKQPEHYPDFYTLRILDLSENGSSYVLNVSRLEHSVYLSKITLCGVMYEAHLTAYTPGGSKTVVLSDFTKRILVLPDKHHVVKLISAILAPIFCIAILSLTTFIICHRRAKLKRYQERCKYFEELEKKAPIDPKATFDFPTKSLPLLTSPEDLTQFQLELEERIFFNDAMEIDTNNIVLYEVLGEGAFGLVRRGVYQDDKLGPREVAVKMLKNHPSGDDMRAFRREIEVMKSVDKHPNIVGIIGHCTKLCNDMLLLTEYCSFGNLLNFLRNEWKYMHELNFKANSISIAKATTRSSSKQQQHRQLQRKRQEPSRSKCHNNTTNKDGNTNNNANNVFNLDATIIEKIKKKYRNLNMSNTTAAAAKDMLAKKRQDIVRPQPAKCNETTSHVEEIASTNSTDNKSYGYDEICTNACKCQVDVLIIKDIGATHGEIENEQLERILYEKTTTVSATATTPTNNNSSSTIQIRNCDCSVLAKNNKKNARIQANGMSIENKGYYKYLADNVLAMTKSKKMSNSTTAPAVTTKLTNKCEKSTSSKNLHSDDYDNLNGANNNEDDDDDNGVGDHDDDDHDDLLIGSAKREPLSAADLLDIAKQVAVGMEFLAKNKVVHRDLAARNVLVAPDRTIKIADFGLSRDVYQENIYKKTGNGKLPIKWLALESMTHQVYTTQSDVWSYGILLYEIVTLGGIPYPSIPTNRLLHLLKTGYRMERPKNCGQDFYNLMYSCWHINPGERPNFTQVIKILEDIMSETPQLHIENLISAKFQRPEEAASDESYLKPL